MLSRILEVLGVVVVALPVLLSSLFMQQLKARWSNYTALYVMWYINIAVILAIIFF
jgi:hypothetical protein